MTGRQKRNLASRTSTRRAARASVDTRFHHGSRAAVRRYHDYACYHPDPTRHRDLDDLQGHCRAPIAGRRASGRLAGGCPDGYVRVGRRAGRPPSWRAGDLSRPCRGLAEDRRAATASAASRSNERPSGERPGTRRRRLSEHCSFSREVRLGELSLFVLHCGLTAACLARSSTRLEQSRRGQTADAARQSLRQ